MKIIISRKGFDSKYGGCPSPIIGDRPISLPIPIGPSFQTYETVEFLYPSGDETNLAKVVQDLGGKTPGKNTIDANTAVHLDPDLQCGSLKGRSDLDWMASLGQSDAALSHLRNQEVKEGDLFLFFGWFRESEWKGVGNCKKLSYKPDAPDRHVLFGWLQVGEILKVENAQQWSDVKNKKYSWLDKHPHMHGPFPKRNAIYIAKEFLGLEGCDAINKERLPGGGVFGEIGNRPLVLTMESPNQLRSIWKLPSFFESNLTYNNDTKDNKRWAEIPTCDSRKWKRLDSAKIGQEFVHIPTDGSYVEWLEQLFIPNR